MWQLIQSFSVDIESHLFFNNIGKLRWFEV